jgi:uncharacterized iron-regulated membrane protein
LHRWTGGLIGLLMAVLALSGTVLVWKDAWIALPHARDPMIEDTARIAALTERLMADPAARPQTITYANRGFGLVKLAYKGEAGAYVDQSGAEVLRWESQWQRPEMWLFDLHDRLFAGETGKKVGGAVSAAGVLFVLTGLVLWWPTRRSFELRLLPKNLSRPAILRHHRDIGVVLTPLLLLFLVTGATLVYRPLAALYLGPGAPEVVTRSLEVPAAPKAALADRLDWAGMIKEARARFPEADVRSLALPRGDSGLITLRLRKPQEWLPNGRTTLWFAADTGRLVAARDGTTLPAQSQAYNTLYPLHAARVGGVGFQLATTLAGLALTLLGSLTVWTFWFARPKRRRRAARAPVAA